jgi:hypothetical protein
MLLAIFAAQLAVQVGVAIAHRLLRPPANILPAWVALFGLAVLVCSTSLVVGAAIRLSRTSRAYTVVAVAGGVVSGLGIVGGRWLLGLPV